MVVVVVVVVVVQTHTTHTQTRDATHTLQTKKTINKHRIGLRDKKDGKIKKREDTMKER